jgi:phosphoribosylanthranilate isomerase
VAAGTHARLRKALPGVSLVQVVHVVGPESVAEAMAVAVVADAILLDSGVPDAATPKLGGTGQTHDWSVSRAIRDRVDVPVILAGGLDGRNAGEAIAAVRPHALDACSRLRTNGCLDEAKAAAFVAACVPA